MTELQIKKALVEFFVRKNKQLILGAEVSFQYGERRADIITIENELATAYEIKSAGDNISRLEYQLDSYRSFFDFCYIVCEKNHLSSIRSSVSKKFGIIVVNDTGLEFIRKSHQFKMHDKEVLASYFSIDKLRQLTGIKSSISKHELCVYASKHLSKEMLHRESRKEMTNRYITPSEMLRMDTLDRVNADDIYTLTKRPPSALRKRP
ncbi:sce7726 family protein [Aeromonas media]|uniref:sce7726 family protein n=1 Tax=Aeromonas media TaxID=651 RepID=UPI0022403EE6|nr:sce7726 family protein [Aeromonas media]